MHETEKIKEAQYFLGQMTRLQEDEAQFRHNLSAFLSAARSALQYALEEAPTKAGGRAWYDAAVSQGQVIRFFKDRRDDNIHVEPVRVRDDRLIKMGDPATMTLTELTEIVKSQGGEVVETIRKLHREHTRENKDRTAEPSPTTVEIVYRFREWGGSESVIDLCQQYLADLTKVVTDGQGRGFLTP